MIDIPISDILEKFENITLDNALEMKDPVLCVVHPFFKGEKMSDKSYVDGLKRLYHEYLGYGILIDYRRNGREALKKITGGEEVNHPKRILTHDEDKIISLIKGHYNGSREVICAGGYITGSIQQEMWIIDMYYPLEKIYLVEECVWNG